MITTKRLHNGNYLLLSNGKEVGSVLTGKGWFGLELKGIYWLSDGRPSDIGGAPIKTFRTIKDAVKYANEIINV